MIRRSNGDLSASFFDWLDASNPSATEAALQQIRSEIVHVITARFGVISKEVGLARHERLILDDAARGGLLCLMGIFATLVLVLRRWSRRIILVTIPFVTIGVVVGHFVRSLPVSILGVFGLAGVVINDAIILMVASRQQITGLSMRLRVVEAATMRFRAIFLTAATILLRLLPILYTQNPQADFLSPIVTTLFYGLAFGMITVPLCVPLLATVLDDILRQWGGLWRRVVPVAS